MVGTITIGADANTYAWNNGVTNGIAFTPSNGYYVVTSTQIVDVLHKILISNYSTF